MLRENIVVQTIEYNHVRCISARPQEAGNAPLPTVLFYHGWGGTIESYQFFATVLAGFGYQVILPELALHGAGERLDNYHTKEAYVHFWDVIKATTRAARGILDELIAQGLADSARLGVAGSSVGGFIASGILAHHLDVKCLVNMNGSPAWEISEEIFRQNDGRPPMNDEEREEMRGWDPMQRLATMAPRAILHMHGTVDQTISVEGARAFVQAVTPFYAEAPERLVMAELSRLDHYVTLGMIEELLGWFDRYL